MSTTNVFFPLLRLLSGLPTCLFNFLRQGQFFPKMFFRLFYTYYYQMFLSVSISLSPPPEISRNRERGERLKRFKSPTSSSFLLWRDPSQNESVGTEASTLHPDCKNLCSGSECKQGLFLEKGSKMPPSGNVYRSKLAQVFFFFFAVLLKSHLTTRESSLSWAKSSENWCGGETLNYSAEDQTLDH